MVSNAVDRRRLNHDKRDCRVTDLEFASGEPLEGTGVQNYEVVFGSSAGEVRQALVDLHAHLSSSGLPRDLCETVQITLGEVLNNIVEHAYGNETGHGITLCVTRSEKGLWCETRDQGAAMPNGEPPVGAMPTVDPMAIMDLAEGGFGWAMVRELTQKIRYQRLGTTNQLQFLIPVIEDA